MIIDFDLYQQYVLIAKNSKIIPSLFELSRLCNFKKDSGYEDTMCSFLKCQCLCKSCTMLNAIYKQLLDIASSTDNENASVNNEINESIIMENQKLIRLIDEHNKSNLFKRLKKINKDE